MLFECHNYKEIQIWFVMFIMKCVCVLYLYILLLDKSYLYISNTQLNI